MRVGEQTPPLNIPEEGKYIWEWFKELSLIASPVFDGLHHPIPPSEYLAWQTITRNIVYSWEYDILFSMDNVYCDEMNKEVQSRRTVQQDRAAQEAKLNGRRKR